MPSVISRSGGSGPKTPYLFAKPVITDDVRRSRITGPAYDKPYYPNSLIDMRPAGLDELWAFGWRQRLLKYDLQLNLKSVVNIYGTPRGNNNHCFVWDARVDFSAGLVFLTTWNYNVVRVYDLNSFVNESYDRNAGAGAGGHLYDLGLPNGTAWFRADKGSATRNGEGGAFYNVCSACLNGGKLYISSYQGYGNATQTSNQGFIAAYDYTATGATFSRIVAAYNGTYSNAIVSTDFRLPYGKLRPRPNSDVLLVPTNSNINGGYGFYEVDPVNNTLLQRRVQPTSTTKAINWRPYGLSFDSGGNLISTQRIVVGAAIAEENNAREMVSFAGASLTDSAESYYQHNWLHHCLKVENVAGRDWLLTADYSAHSLALYPAPTGESEGEATVNTLCALEDVNGSAAAFPDGAVIVRAMPDDAAFNLSTNVAAFPLGQLEADTEIVLLLA